MSESVGEGVSDGVLNGRNGRYGMDGWDEQVVLKKGFCI